MGYIQLAARGAQDFNLIGNPQISFYKIVYRRYSNFSVESKQLKINGNPINNTDTVMLDCDIKRDGDLLSNVYFTFELPDIYSGCYDTARGTDPKTALNVPYEFRWVENIGTNIINNVKLILNDSVIHSYSGEYLQVMSELRYDDSKKKIYDELVGNVPEMHNPSLHNRENNLQKPEFVAIITTPGTGYTAEPVVPLHSDLVTTSTPNYDYQTTVADGSLTSVNIVGDQYNFVDGGLPIVVDGGNGRIKLHNSSYPHIRGTTTDQHNIHRTFGSETIIRHTAGTLRTIANDLIPSIRKRKIKVPLNFYFTKSTGLALPLISLQYTQVKVEIKLNPIRNLYTVLDYKNNPIGGGGEGQVVRIKPETTMTIDLFTEQQVLNINPSIEAEYVFLDTDERNRFAINSHEYLIEDVFKPPSLKNIRSTKDHNIILHHPVKELIIVSQRSDMEYVNNWNNYSNWTIENVAPTSFRYNNMENMYYSTQAPGNLHFYNRYLPNPTLYKKEFFNENIIENIEFRFDGHIRLGKKDSGYFNLVQPFQHHKRKIKKGIHVYSFSLKPDDFQPSGACNFSRVNNFKIHIDLGIKSGVKEIPTTGNGNYFNYNFNIYAVHYNILKIASGLGAKQYVN